MRVYLDHNAGASLRPEAREAMLAVLGAPANPSSSHREGARARALVAEARAAVAAAIGARPAEIVFTSGATEANNLALCAAPGRRVVTTAIEHASVLEPAARRETLRIGVDAQGGVDAGTVLAAVAGTAAGLVSVGLANGEVGSIAPLAAIAAGVRGRGVLVHTDAAQAAGRLPIDVRDLGVDLLSLSSHKLGGPAGVGALWVRHGVTVPPLVVGGPQERGRRAGTENVAGIVGFGAAARAATADLDAAAARMRALTERLWEGLRIAVPDVRRHGPHGGAALPNTLNVGVPGCAGESLLVLLDLDGVAVSLGSACAAGAPEPSHVLLAMGCDRETARAGLRFSLGPTTTAAEIDAAVAAFPRAVRQVRGYAAA